MTPQFTMSKIQKALQIHFKVTWSGFSITSLISSTAISLIHSAQAQRTPCCSSNMPGTILPQNLCTCCIFSLESSFSRCLHGSLSRVLQIFAQISVSCGFLINTTHQPQIPEFLRLPSHSSIFPFFCTAIVTFYYTIIYLCIEFIVYCLPTLPKI